MARTPPPKLANKFASLDAEQTKKTYADLSEAIRGRSEAFEGAYRVAADRWHDLIPCLAQMRSLLSQRGEQRRAVLREAGLPGWTEWFERFRTERGWNISMRAVQKKLAAFRDGSDGGKHGKGEGGGRAARPDSEKPLYRRGYVAGKAEMGAQVKAAAERQAALAGRVAELEKENEWLQGIAGGFQQQPREVGDKAAGRPRKGGKETNRPPETAGEFPAAEYAAVAGTRRMVAERNPKAVLLEEDFDECIIGTTLGPAPVRAIYNYELLVDAMTKRHFADDTREAYEIEHAVEDLICYNILGWLVDGDPNMPLVVSDARRPS